MAEDKGLIFNCTKQQTSDYIHSRFHAPKGSLHVKAFINHDFYETNHQKKKPSKPSSPRKAPIRSSKECPGQLKQLDQCEH
jgi:uncharacterized membrane protein (UPF0127 family)